MSSQTKEIQTRPNPSRLPWLILGLSGLGLAVAGAALPILPATPFVFVALAGLSRSSPRLERWLRSRPFVKERIARLERGEGLSRREKIGIFAMAAALIIPVIVITSSLHLRIFLATLLVAKAVFLITWRAKPKAAGVGR
jgi:uncharacterized membrane protein YbaN (DUF454 family)